MHVSYPKTLTKMNICSERTLPFHTLNEHILLIKRDFEMKLSLGKIVSRACANVPNANILHVFLHI